MLRDYQSQAINQIFSNAESGIRKQIYQLPTGAGKTITFGGLVDQFLTKYHKSQVLIVVHRTELLKQCRETFYKAFQRNSFPVMANVKNIPHSQIYVGMVETVFNRIKSKPDLFKNIGLLIVDEVHIANFNKLYEHFPNALIVGVTATPISASKKHPLKDNFQDIVTGPQIGELIKDNYLMPNMTYSLKGINRKSFGIKRGEFDNFTMGKVFGNSRHVNNTVVAFRKLCEGQKTLIFNCNIEHSKLVNAAFINAGYNSKHLDGNESDTNRKNILAWFAKTPNAILNSVGILTMGFDEPSIHNVIVNRSTMSLPLWLQMCIDTQTEILTKDGWKKNDEIENGDFVASYNIYEKTINYAPCKNKVYRQIYNSESFYELKSPFIDIRITNEHNLLYRNRQRQKNRENFILEKAEVVSKIKQTYEMPIAGYIKNEGLPLNDDEIRFIGWVLSGGTIDKKTKRVTITQSKNQPKYLHESIINSIKGCGFKYTITEIKRKGDLAKYADLILYRVSFGNPRGKDKHLTGCKRLFKYLDKNIYTDLFKMNKHQMGCFLETLNYGDGLKLNNVGYTPRSMRITAGNNKQFADRLQHLCIINGYKCNLSTHNYNNQPLYYLSIKDRDYASIKGRNEKDGNKLQISKTSNRKEMVWCVETIDNTIITRRNGKVCIMGNCGRGSRLFDNKHYFKIIDLGGNALAHGDWGAYRDWSNVFYFPDEPSKSKGIAPIKICNNCEAIIPAQSMTCEYCGQKFERVVNYDRILPDFELHTNNYNVYRQVAINNKIGAKEWKTFFDILNHTVTILKYKIGETEITEEFIEKSWKIFEAKVIEWRRAIKKPYAKNIQAFAKLKFEENLLKLKVAC